LIHSIFARSSLFLALALSVTAHAASSTAPADPSNPIKRIFVLVFENTNAVDSQNQPFMKSLIARGSYLNNFHGIAHPSQPNYLAMVGGDNFGVRDDRNHDVDATHLGDLLEAKGKNWKIYSEDYPTGSCFTGSNSRNYVRKHNPFISFNNVHQDSARCQAHIVSSDQLDSDLAAGKLPEYAMFVPGLKNDGHDTGVAFADRWFQATLGPKLADPRFMDGTLFVVTFDENDAFNDTDHNKIYTLLFGAGVKPGVQSEAQYDHYSLLRLIEDALKLGTLGRKDQTAIRIQDVLLSPM
jgi:acid phosphatase